ncbi:hypothetical protein ACNI3K_06050 [Demequina sp. SO4-13]|uniref:hypothetical protein n=1 Tax=Demequina sp. SO4-13 TaxID=3401027 RepID=UPI003AF5DB34
MSLTTDLESRTYFSTLDGALADFELPLGAVDKARAALRFLEYEHVFIPHSREHVALERAGETAPVAYITRTFVAIHPPDGPSDWVQIAEPESVQAPPADARAGSGIRRASPRRRSAAEPTRVTAVSTCPSCYTNLPATGVCDWCG